MKRIGQNRQSLIQTGSCRKTQQKDTHSLTCLFLQDQGIA
nr:unnamed protein product [Callosobruchus analis]